MQAPALHARHAPFVAAPRRGAAGSTAVPCAPLRTRHAARRVRPSAALDAGTLSAVTGAASTGGWQIYGALGSGAAAFAGTFFVAPFFKDRFKEQEPWEKIYEALAKQGVPAISPAEASKRRGALLLDVRLSDAVAKRSIPRAVPIPLYVPIRNWDVFSNVRRVAFAFFGLAGTELSPTFVADVAVATKGNKNAELVVMCERGGSLENRPGMKSGFQSRSLKALYYLRQAGYRNVRHLTGGVTAWAADGLPVQDAE